MSQQDQELLALFAAAALTGVIAGGVVIRPKVLGQESLASLIYDLAVEMVGEHELRIV